MGLGLTLEDIAVLRGKVALPLRFERNETPIVKSGESWDDF